ncbi:MAG: ERCC4 domain-containing protein [Lachnospiraceae bacterium]
MTVQIDTREKQKAIKKILAAFDAAGVKHISSKLYVGDYMSMDAPRYVIDRKQNLFELCSNVCQQHRRFTAELIRAKEAGIHITILCEHGGNIRSLEDVAAWQNPRLSTSPLAVSGERLHKILSTMAKTYDFDLCFCNKAETGHRIVTLLEEAGNKTAQKG